MKLVVATTNSGKLGEIREIIQGFTLVSLADLKLPAPDETGATFQDNAALKATACATWSGEWTLGDDSGLCVDALGGAPGVFSARYAPTDEERRSKLLRALSGVPEARRGAYFFCAVVLSAPDGKRIWRAEGRVAGRIVEAERGSNGFGYDPLFEPFETPGRTIAELSMELKNKLSHRGRALERLRPVLAELLAKGAL